jgi:hypothetical protein
VTSVPERLQGIRIQSPDVGVYSQLAKEASV